MKLFLLLVLLAQVVRGSPLFDLVWTAEPKALWISSASVANSIELEGYEEMIKPIAKDQTPALELYSTVRWLEATVYKWDVEHKIKAEISEDLKKWYADVKWEEHGRKLPLGLEPKKTLILKDSDDEKLIWHLKVYDRRVGHMVGAIRCMEGLSQARPDVKFAILDPKVCSSLWDMLDKEE